LTQNIKRKTACPPWLAFAATMPRIGRQVKIAGRDASVDGLHLRIIIHANEHMVQLIAYARMTGVVPPWSKE
jgi:hypothetical protein